MGVVGELQHQELEATGHIIEASNLSPHPECFWNKHVESKPEGHGVFHSHFLCNLPNPT